MSTEWSRFSKAGLNYIDNSDAFINLAEGAVRSSKSVCSSIRYLNFIIEETQVGDPLVITGKTERTIDRNIIAEYQNLLGKKRVKPSWGKGYVDIMGRRNYIIAGSDRSSESKLRGGTFKGALIDEASLLPENFWNMLISRCSMEGAKLFATTNPDSPYHYLYKYVNQYDQHCKAFHFKLTDNLSLSKAYIKNLEVLFSGLWRKRFIDGIWCMAEGVIYDMFNPEIHVLPNQTIDAIAAQKADEGNGIAIDYATSSVFVALYGFKSKGNIYIQHEYHYDAQARGIQKTDTQFREELCNFIKANNINYKELIVDPSAASFKLELKLNMTSRVRDANNAVLDGIRNVGSLLAGNKLFIAERCRNLLQEMTSYVWDENRQKLGEDVPVKEHDHSQDALRYLCARLQRQKMRFTEGIL